MDILFVTSHFGTSETVGFMPVVATALADRNHDVRGVQYQAGETIDSIPVQRIPTRERYTPYWAGQWWFYRHWRPTMRSYLQDEGSQFDAVIVDKRCAVPTIQAAEHTDVSVIAVVPGLGFTRFAPRNLSRDKTPRFGSLPASAKIQYPFVRSLHRQHREGLARAEGIVVVSEFLQDRLRATYDIDSTVVRTPVVPETIRAEENNPEAVAMINPRTELKGGGIFLDVVEAMPEQEFVVAGSFALEEQARRAASLQNLTTLGWVDDMREVYSRSSVVLVPSLVEEGGPRVIAEAFVNGVPVIGTRRGGTTEFIGSAGETIDSPDDVDEWAETIRAVIADRTTYARRASNRADLFHISEAVARLEQLLRENVD